MGIKADAAGVRCSTCRESIDMCYFCDEPECPKAICYTCIAVALKQMEPHPHAHGG